MSGDIVDPNVIVLRIAERLRDLATEDGRIPFRTGDLRKSIQVELLGKGVAAVGSNLNYARAVHEGRPALVIRPKNKKALFWPGARHPVKAVHQPARKGQPFLREAAEEMEREGYGFLDRYLTSRVSEELAKEIKGKVTLTLKL